MKTLERLSNIAVIVTALVVICAVFVRHGNQGYTGGHPSSRQLERQLRGGLISNRQLLPHGNTFACVLVLSTKCPFCEQNAPLYRELTARRTADNFRLIGVFPQGQSGATEYLRNREIIPDEVISITLQDLGVQATPTILLVNHEGRTLAAWVGALDKGRQKEVFENLSQFTRDSRREIQQ